jgi:uncharacterized protein with PIN domain
MQCLYCSQEIPSNAKRCPLCLKAVITVPEDDVETDVDARAGSTGGEETYELPSGPAEIPAEWQGGSVYSLELPARCPHCREMIRTVRILRLKRAQVTFTSTLPRGGRVIVCPECERILSVELAAL